MNKINLIIIAIIIALVFLGIGFVAGKKSLEDKLIEAQKIIDAYTLPTPEEIFSVNGEIKEIKDNVITLEISPLGALPLPGEEAEKETIKVRVGEETKIVKREIPMDPLQEPKETEISLTDLKPGDWINATSEKNIKDKKEFTAKSIELTEQLPDGTAPLPGGEVPPLSDEDEPAPVSDQGLPEESEDEPVPVP